MRKPYLIAGIASRVGSLSQIIAGNFFAAWATGLFAASLLFSYVTYVPAPAKEVAGSQCSEQNLDATLPIITPIYSFGYDIGRALYRATHHTAAVKQAK